MSTGIAPTPAVHPDAGSRGIGYAFAALLWVAAASAGAWLLASMPARLALAGDRSDWRMPDRAAKPSAAHRDDPSACLDALRDGVDLGMNWARLRGLAMPRGRAETARSRPVRAAKDGGAVR